VVPGVKLDITIFVVSPEQIVGAAGVAIAKGTGFTVTTTDTQVVLPQPPCALTK
jgi:hypothetical protein